MRVGAREEAAPATERCPRVALEESGSRVGAWEFPTYLLFAQRGFWLPAGRLGPEIAPTTREPPLAPARRRPTPISSGSCFFC